MYVFCKHYFFIHTKMDSYQSAEEYFSCEEEFIEPKQIADNEQSFEPKAKQLSSASSQPKTKQKSNKPNRDLNQAKMNQVKKFSKTNTFPCPKVPNGYKVTDKAGKERKITLDPTKQISFPVNANKPDWYDD